MIEIWIRIAEPCMCCLNHYFHKVVTKRFHHVKLISIKIFLSLNVLTYSS